MYLYKLLRCFDQFSESYKVTEFWIRCEWRHTHEYTKHFIPGFLCIFSLNLWKKNIYTPFFNKMRSFVWLNCVSTKLTSYTWMNMEYANCSLHVNFWKVCLMPFRSMMIKDHFKQTSLSWPQIPFKKIFSFKNCSCSFSTITGNRRLIYLDLLCINFVLRFLSSTRSKMRPRKWGFHCTIPH